jgi:hypothetical protein
MKIKYSRIIILTAFAAVIIAGIAILRPKENSTVSKSVQPVQQRQPVQVTEITPVQKGRVKKMTKEVLPVSEAETEQVPVQISSQPQMPIIRETVEKPVINHVLESPLDITYDSDRADTIIVDANMGTPERQYFANELPTIELTPQQQRYEERFRQVEEDIRPTITPEQAEQMRRQAIAKLPEKYRKIIENMEQMKEARMQRRQMWLPKNAGSEQTGEQLSQGYVT